MYLFLWPQTGSYHSQKQENSHSNFKVNPYCFKRCRHVVLAKSNGTEFTVNAIIAKYYCDYTGY